MRIIPEHELAPDDEPCYDCNRIRVTPITITDWTWRPDSWPEFVKYFEDRPKHWPLTERDLWEFGATSMLNALISLTGEGTQ